MNKLFSKLLVLKSCDGSLVHQQKYVFSE